VYNIQTLYSYNILLLCVYISNWQTTRIIRQLVAVPSLNEYRFDLVEFFNCDSRRIQLLEFLLNSDWRSGAKPIQQVFA